jgi:hypothetical protein
MMIEPEPQDFDAVRAHYGVRSAIGSPERSS